MISDFLQIPPPKKEDPPQLVLIKYPAIVKNIDRVSCQLIFSSKLDLSGTRNNGRSSTNQLCALQQPRSGTQSHTRESVHFSDHSGEENTGVGVFWNTASRDEGPKKEERSEQGEDKVPGTGEHGVLVRRDVRLPVPSDQETCRIRGLRRSDTETDPHGLIECSMLVEPVAADADSFIPATLSVQSVSDAVNEDSWQRNGSHGEDTKGGQKWIRTE